MKNLKLINNFCENYGFKNVKYFDGIQIITPSDWWVIKNINNDKIELYHKNKRQGTGYHFQKYFTSLRDLFKYIYNHEQKPFKSHRKTFRIKELLNAIS